jgi:hypothetical protein
MPEQKPLKPQDFPIVTDKNKLTTIDGKEVAEATTPPVAEDLADRLNEDAARKEEERWSF